MLTKKLTLKRIENGTYKFQLTIGIVLNYYSINIFAYAKTDKNDGGKNNAETEGK